MNRNLKQICLSLLAASLQLLASGDELPLSEVPSLIKTVIANQRKQDGKEAFSDYVSTVKVSMKNFSRSGKLKSFTTDTYEHYPAYPRSITIMTESNGSPTSPSKLEKERNRALKEMEVFLASKDKMNTSQAFENRPGNVIFLGVYDFLRNSDFYATSTEILDGRKTVALKFRPKTGWIDPSGIIHSLHGVIWIDCEYKIASKAKAWIIDPSIPDGTFFEMTYKLIKPNTWALSYFRINPAVKPELFKNERFDWYFNSDGFQFFSVENGSIVKIN